MGKGPGLITSPVRKHITSQFYIFASLPHSKRGFGVGFQQETYRQCKQKYKMRTKEKKKSEACWLCGLIWLL